MPIGFTIRAVIWQRLHPMPPPVIDNLPLPVIGALFGHHMVESSRQEVEEAARIMSTRLEKVQQFQAKYGKRKKKPK